MLHKGAQVFGHLYRRGGRAGGRRDRLTTKKLESAREALGATLSFTTPVYATRTPRLYG